MISDYAQRLIFEVVGAGKSCRHGNERLEQVDIVVVVHFLQDGSKPFEAHAGINRGFRQWVHRAIRITVILHEYQVPDLDVAITIFFGCPGGATFNFCAMIVEYFAAGSARPGITH